MYIDVAYGVHTDSGKSNSSFAVQVGTGLGVGSVSVSSSKQKIATKSSTESELVALMNFLKAQGYETQPCQVMQDNMSTIALIRRGQPGALGSRHINIRYFCLKDRMDNGEVIISHLPTEK